MSGRTFPVELFYSQEPPKNYVEAAQKLVLQVGVRGMALTNRFT